MSLSQQQRDLCAALGLPESLVDEVTKVPAVPAGAKTLREGDAPPFAKKDKKDSKDDKKKDEKPADDKSGKPSFGKDKSVKKDNPFQKSDDVGEDGEDDTDEGSFPKPPFGKNAPVNGDAPFGQQQDSNVETPEEKEAKKAAKLADKAREEVANDLRANHNTKPDKVTFYPSTDRIEA